MSQEMTTLCLVGLGFGFLVLLAAFIMLRVMRASVFGLGMLFLRMISEPKEEPSTVQTGDINAQAYVPTDLRSKAQALDFDAAVAKYRQEQPPPTPNSPLPGYPQPPQDDQPGAEWPR